MTARRSATRNRERAQAPCAPLLGRRARRRHRRRRPARLARARRRRRSTRARRTALRRGRSSPPAWPACCGRRAPARERGAWIAIGAGDPHLGRRRGLLDAAILATTPRPPTPRRPTSATSPSTRWPRLGLVLLVRARASELDWRLWMDGLIAALGTAALGAAFVFDFVADQTSGTPLQVATTLAYPLGDIVMLSLVVGVDRPHPLAPGPRPGRCCSPASPRWSSPTSPTPCSRPSLGAARQATGSTRST